jgi:erythronate-4-phosphate dehydrogenase
LLACRRLGKNTLTQRFGIVGCGNVGGTLRRLLESLDIEVLACDPPLEARGIEGFCTMEEALDCDTVSLHVPLNRGGPWPTHHMLDEPAFKRLSTDTLLINACRGDVVQGRALKDWLSKGGQAALDVWPGEPDIDPELVRLASVATPHVAGYSLEGKLRATAMVHQALCAHFGVQQSVDLTPAGGPRLNLDLMTQGEFDDIVLQVCPVERDDRALRERLDEADAHARIAAYDALRSHYPARREFGAWSLDGNLAPGVSQTLRKLGFSLPPP